MDKKRIGLILTGNYNWAGGLYYVANIIKSQLLLEENLRPQIVVFINNATPKEITDELVHRNVQFVNLNQVFILKKIWCKVLGKTLNRNVFLEKIINEHNLNFVYPFIEYQSDLKKVNCDIYYWIYDFQHKFMPELFSEEEINKRDTNFKAMALNAGHIIVSSNTAKTHFYNFFPNSKAKIHVLRFTSIIDHSLIQDKITLATKYDFSKPYFMVCNQFWAHKNHIIVLEAIKKLVTKSRNFKVYFSGKQHDPRNIDYVASLKNFISDNDLQSNIVFTGFIDRYEQLGLMKNAIAIIQPSKFEGWSTVVEDSKCLNKKLLVSSIDIHKEQVSDNAHFFDVNNAQALSDLMLNSLEGVSNSNSESDYTQKIKQFGLDFLELADS